MCSSWISQSSCINVYIYEMFLEVSVSDGLAAQIVVRPQNALLPLVSGCVHTLNVAPFGNYVQLPCVLLWWSAAHLRFLNISSKILVLHARVVSKLTCWQDVTAGDFLSSSRECLCGIPVMNSPCGTMDTVKTLLNISWCS